jgi:hypothetical protein
MGHLICSVKTVPNQSIVKLNLFNYFEKKLGEVTLNKYETPVELNDEIILHFPTRPRHRRCFLSSNRNIQPN